MLLAVNVCALVLPPQFQSAPSKGGNKTITKFLVAENGPFGTPFLTPKVPPKKFMWVPFLSPFQEMRHINFFLGAQKGVFWVGAQKVYVEKVYVLFRSPTEYDRAKVPPYNGNDPPPAPRSLKALLFPALLNKVENKGTQGVRARYDVELPPIISIVRYPPDPIYM